MQPEQQIPANNGQDPYDFILAGPPKQKKSLIPGGGSLKQRVILVVGGALGLMLVLYVIFSLAFSGGGGLAKLTTIAQKQTEIIRISNAGSSVVREPSISNFTQSVLLTTTSGQQQTVDYLASHGKKVKTKQLALLQSSKTDQALESAKQAGQYDNALLGTLLDRLKDYRASVKEAYDDSSSQTQKALLKQLFQQADGLLANPPQSVN